MSLLRRIEKTQQVANQPAAEPEDRSTRLEDLRIKRTPVAPVRDTFNDLKTRIHKKLIAELDPKMDVSKTDEIRQTIEEMYDGMLVQENMILGRADRQRLLEQIVAEILGYGPIEPLLAADDITEIMVNGPNSVYIERQGRLELTEIKFESDEHVARIIDRIVSPLGRRIDESQPYVDARLPDGSRVNAVIPPLSLVGPILTIRKFARIPITAQTLVDLGTLTPEALEFCKACVQAKLNLVISGGTGSGKTTTLNVMSAFIPNDERIITIENAAELQLQQDHVLILETRPANVEGKGEVPMRTLVINSLRMRPDRIIVGECRGAEALDMLQAMNTGHDGSMTTAHSNSPRDTLARLETMVLMAGMDLPLRAIREQIASALNLVIHQERMRDGTRKITKITEVQGMEGDVIVMQDLFVFEQQGIEAGKVIGRLKPTGIRPKFVEIMEAANIHLPPTIFGVGRRF
ncbi:MAG: CpaF family protein [Anaerolineae bacterium]|jgi:pilus assembly protein CpaF|nr:CpaF family protein [Anaerolineae bacterium]MDX9831903.1 CpaF family protein [Anaerolineae bacterium]